MTSAGSGEKELETAVDAAIGPGGGSALAALISLTPDLDGIDDNQAEQ